MAGHRVALRRAHAIESRRRALDVVKGLGPRHIFAEDKYATCAYYDIHDRDKCDADFFPLSQDICSKRFAKSSTAGSPVVS